MLRFRDKCVFAFNAEIQDGPQKWWETIFGEKLPVDSAGALWVKNFVDMALSRSVSKINTFLCLTQKFKMAAKVAKNDICKKSPVDSADTLWLKNFVEIALSRNVRMTKMLLVMHIFGHVTSLIG